MLRKRYQPRYQKPSQSHKEPQQCSCHDHDKFESQPHFSLEELSRAAPIHPYQVVKSQMVKLPKPSNMFNGRFASTMH